MLDSFRLDSGRIHGKRSGAYFDQHRAEPIRKTVMDNLAGRQARGEAVNGKPLRTGLLFAGLPVSPQTGDDTRPRAFRRT